MLKKLIYLTTYLFAVVNLQAQEEDWATKLASAEFKAKKVIPPTPEAAALGKYGNIPMNLFTGTPTISVPLYQLSGNNISLPIQLSYNAGGFNPQEIAPWTGLGWSLSAGGVVTRSVMGNPDAISNYFISPSPLEMPSQTSDPYGFYAYMENLRKGDIEAQPDMYYYNFAGQSGKFLVKPDNSILKKEKNNYQIVATNVGFYNGSNIIITDEQGVTYEFREFETSVMTPDDISTDVPIRTYTYPSTWYLTKIISADGFEEIEFTYYTTPLDHSQFNNFYQTESAVYQETIPLSGSPSFYGPEIKAYQPATVKTKRKYLQQITLKRAGVLITYIDFESFVDQRQDLDHNTNSGFPGEHLLDSIKVYTKKVGTTFSLTKQFNFNYGYFTNSGNSGWDHKRLRLDNVQEIPVLTGALTIPPYSFEYSNDSLMPGLNTTAMDHWGFYNKPNGSNTLVPNTNTYGGGLNITAENREPSFEGASSYLITKIKYPTGGYTMFDYELNQAKEGAFEGAISFNVGGVRIKRITDYSFDTKKAMEKNYKYELADGSTSGLAIIPQYLSASSYEQLGTPPGGGSPNICTAELLSTKITYSVSANSISGLGSIQGSHIGYSRVTENMTDPVNGQALGKTVYDYSFEGSWDIHDSYGNGDLLKKSHYDNSGKLIQETKDSFNYVYNGSIGAVAPGVSGQQSNRSSLVKMTNPAGGFFYGWYMSSVCASNVVESRIYKTRFVNGGWANSSREKQLTEQLVKQYDQLTNSYLTITKKFTYDNTAHTLPTKIEQSTTNNEVVITEKKYPLDYIIPTSGILDNNTTGIKLQKDKNIIGAGVESIQYRQNPDGSNKRHINGMITTYNPYIPFPNQLYRLESTAPLSSFSMSSTTGGVFSFNSNYKSLGSFVYNSNGTLLQQSKDLDIPSAYVWDYDYQYATAEVANAETGQIAYSSFETDGSGEWTSIPNINSNRIVGGISGKYSYLLAGDNITKTELSPSRQYTISYWSLNGSITVTAIPSGSPSPVTGSTRGSWTYYEHLLPVNTTSVTLSGSGKTIDELRLYPKDALMTTMTYDPLVGITSQCDANNRITYYEYDEFNRLKLILDQDGNIIKTIEYHYKQQ